MNFSRPFIERPIGTTLLAIGLFLIGAVAYNNLPVASLPSVEFPTIRVIANLPGGDPETMAARVAAPLERRIGEIPGVTELTSANVLGTSRITVQFDASRNIVGAAQDVQAAINAAAVELPADMPSLPSFRKSNPAAAPILILALTSKTIPPDRLYDVADTVIVQRLSQVEGVAEVTAAGAEQPAVRVRVNPMLLASMGLSIEAVRTAIVQANALAPLGFIEGAKQAIAIETNAQLGMRVEDYKRIAVKTAHGDVVRLGAVAEVMQATRNSRSAANFNNQPAILLNVTKSADANVIETVDRIRALLPALKSMIPEGIDISVLSDRTTTLRASVHDMQLTLGLSIVLVMLVVYLFLRRPTPTIAAGITVPLSLAGTCAAMWAAGFSVNNLTLMALAVSVGFVVDDAIVMIENMFRNLERGATPMRAALDGARQIGFTVIAISVSLIAAFIPLLFNSNANGRLMREFSVTLAFAVVVSTVVSLTVTPMICAHFIRAAQHAPARRALLDRVVEAVIGWALRSYAASLDVALRHRVLTMLVMLLTVAATVNLYVKTPKGTFPQDDTGLIIAWTQAASDISFDGMAKLQQQALDAVRADPAVANVGSSVGASGWNSSVNRGSMFISLKPLKERDGLTTQRVINRMRGALADIEGLSVFFVAARDIRGGARQGRSDYQFTFWSPDFDDLYAWVPKVVDRLKQVPGLVDVTTDRETGGLQATISINRQAAARLGVRVQDINSALNNAFSQRQISILYTDRNQYRVILEVDPSYQRDPSDLNRLFVPGRDGAQVPLTSVVSVTRTLAPLVVNHQGPFPAVTVEYSITPDMPLAAAQEEIRKAIAELRMPDSIRAEAAGDAKAFEREAGQQALLILTALIAVYIVLGVLYESLAHPLTIISTLPAAGLGALVALRLWGMELTVIAFIGIILLIGIVKKNGIMLIDFALEAERERGLSAARAIHEACLERFRPIMMTTFAALLGAIPLAIATGPGTELRRPLGITIIGGLIVSQVLTLYTTPVIYLLLDRLHRRLSSKREPLPEPGVA
ncbi:MAG TPA: efflux RND transporter permease subunit [Hyphomicrobiaceae bacterium]|jgi:multidrug efflux pump|nr:efflux RND transporter permease subunit [Hyphomicrobiaceae bacterium]